ncbi:MAG TPA: DegT/DnrJ/EryC1/StrS family aminotransferase [Sulfuricurvum sp.]|nr:DegT/DnrJ/EryC1/StrS family aminotransferase [Sulfuricurvum sp.]
MSIPFFRVEVGGDEREKIDEVFDGEAPNIIEDLEAAFEMYTGATHALTTSNGTNALHLAMFAIDLKRGDKVLCSINAYPSVPEVVRHFDAEPIFIDIDPSLFSIDLEKLDAYLHENKSKKLKAVIVSHIAGQSIDLDRLYAIAKTYDIKVIEDASDALGATYKGQKIGSTGADITCFDFSPHLRKNVCNGGMLVSDDEEIIERAKSLRHHAMEVEDDTLGYIYNVTDIGSQYTISPLDAAVILVQLEKQDDIIARQQEIAAIFNERLADAPHISLPIVEQDHTFSLYIIKIDKNRDSFARELKERGIETGLHYIPLHLLSYYKAKYSLRINDFPVALRNYSQVLSIPNYAALSDEDVEEICDAILDVAATRV